MRNVFGIGVGFHLSVKALTASALASLVLAVIFIAGPSRAGNTAEAVTSFPGWSSITTIYYQPSQDDPTNRYLQEAATELKAELERVDSRVFTVATSARPSTGIFLEVNAALPEFQGKSSESFRLFSDSSGIHVTGKTPVAVRHGVFALLERLGYRWLFAHPAWHIKPRALDDAISLNEVQSPYFETRRYGIPRPHHADIANGRENYVKWTIRNRMSGNMRYAIGHSSQVWASPSDIQRIAPSAMCDDRGIYYDHPVIIDRAEEFVLNDLRSPTVSHDETGDQVIRLSASLSPMDGSRSVCGSSDQDKANRVFRATNEVARRIRSRYPDKFVSQLSYSTYWAVPDFPLEPNVHVWVTDEARAKHVPFDQRVAGFASQGIPTGIYLYYDATFKHWKDQILPTDVEDPAEDAFWRLIDRVMLGVKGGARASIVAEGHDNWAAKGRAYYLLARLAWDPTVDPQVYLDDFFTYAFGDASEVMKRYYTRFDTEGVSDATYRQAFLDLREALRIAEETNDPGLAERVRHVILHTYWNYRWRTPDYLYTRFPSVQEAREFHTYTWRVRDLSLLTFIKHKDKMREALRDTYGLSDAEISRLEVTNPPSPQEVEAWLNEALASLGVQDPPDGNGPSSPCPVNTLTSTASVSPSGIQPGATVFRDRSFVFESVPQELSGAVLVQTSNDDKGNSSSDYLAFEVKCRSTIYVAYDARASTLPSWLRGWEDTGLTVRISDPSGPVFALYRDAAQPGTLTFGGNLAGGPTGARSNYFVAVVGHPSEIASVLTPTATLVEGGLASGALVYSDRDYVFTTIPDRVSGATYLMTANNDKARSDAGYIKLLAHRPLTVYVGYDSRATSLPAWLSGWTGTGEALGTTDVSLNLFARDFPQGEITLGGNLASGAAGARSNYTVALVVSVPPGDVENQPPSVDAGEDQTIVLPASVSLDGTVTDDGLPDGALSVTWSKVSGPGEVSFADATATDTTALFSSPGQYVLRLEATDGELSASDDTTITVLPPDDPGGDQPVLSMQNVELKAGQSGNVAIVLDQLPQGLAGYRLAVTLDNPAVAQFTGAGFPAFGLTDHELVSPSRILLHAVDTARIVGPGASGVTLATVALRGVAEGGAGIGVEVLALDDDAGNPIAPTLATGVVTVLAGFPTLPGMDSPASDLDGDGKAEDVDGDGAFTIDDVKALFENIASSAVQDNISLFDFNGDGSADLLDALALMKALIDTATQ